jgi:hypothetical protein
LQGTGIFLDFWPEVLSFCGRGWFESDDTTCATEEDFFETEFSDEYATNNENTAFSPAHESSYETESSDEYDPNEDDMAFPMEEESLEAENSDAHATDFNLTLPTEQDSFETDGSVEFAPNDHLVLPSSS